MEEIPNNQERVFTGVWIPAEIMLDERLQPQDKILYAEIASYGERGCWKKSEELQAHIGVKQRALQEACKRLRTYGYITEKRVYGRIMRVTNLSFDEQRQNSINAKKASLNSAKKASLNSAKKASFNKNKVKNKVDKTIVTNVTKESPDSSDLEAKPVESYGNSEINEFMDLWAQEIGVPITSRVRMNRYTINRLLKKYGHQGLAQLIHAAAVASSDRYAPSISSFEDLEKKLSQLLLWAKKRSSTVTSRAVTEANYQQETNDVIVEGY